ncbi:MAG: TIGR02206 family membrane protein [Anaerolineae bacterium]
MGNFFAGENYQGTPFQLFGPSHLVALALIVLLNLWLLIRGERLGPRARLRWRYGLAAVLLIDEAILHAWRAGTGQWSLQTMLPLHLCSVLIFLGAVMLIRKDKRIYEFAYFLGIAGATQALLTPDAGQYGFPHFRAFQVMISHGSIVTAAIYMTAVEGFRPTWASLRRVLIGTNLYMIFVGLVNVVLGSNYLFIAHKPETASLMDVLPAWPWYIPVLELIGAALCLLLYLPFALRDLRAVRTQSEIVS